MAKFKARKKITKEKIKEKDNTFTEINLTKMAKRQLLITVISILAVTFLSIGSAFAIFTSISKSKDYNVIKVGTLNIDFGEDANNTINLNGQYPMSDTDGLKGSPYTFTITNTGTLAASFKVKIEDDTDMITSDNCSGNQLGKDFIKYSLDGKNAALLSNIADSNYIIDIGTLASGESKTYNIYVWIKEGATNESLNKHYHGKITIEGQNQRKGQVAEVLTDDSANNINMTDLKQTFVTGENPNNYIWYSGKLWRAVSIDPSDNSVKLVTQWNISGVPYNDANTNSSFSGSHMEMWLNDTTVDGFLGNLREPENFIKMDSKWNATEDTRELGSITRPDDESGSIVEDAVGLLNVYEYLMSYSGTTYDKGYLNNHLSWWTITPSEATGLWVVLSDEENNGVASPYEITDGWGIRPSVNLKSSVQIESGSGTSDNPYRLAGDNDTPASGTLLSTRYSGEYIRFGVGENNLYRIVSKENGTGVKITSAISLKGVSKKYNAIRESRLTYNEEDSNYEVAYFLNHDYLEPANGYLTSDQVNMIEDNSSWYLGLLINERSNYRLAKYTNTAMEGLTTSTEAKIGLLRAGEQLAGQFDEFSYNRFYWLLTLHGPSYMKAIHPTGSLHWADAMMNSVDQSGGSLEIMIRPAMNLKSSVKITGGRGTKENPFEISL